MQLRSNFRNTCKLNKRWCTRCHLAQLRHYLCNRCRLSKSKCMRICLLNADTAAAPPLGEQEIAETEPTCSTLRLDAESDAAEVPQQPSLSESRSERGTSESLAAPPQRGGQPIESAPSAQGTTPQRRVKRECRERGGDPSVYVLRYPLECWQCDRASLKGLVCL